MDPLANIIEQRILAGLIVRNVGDETIEDDVSNNDIVRLAELVLALDEWRTNGGFDPYVSTEHPATLCDNRFAVEFSGAVAHGVLIYERDESMPPAALANMSCLSDSQNGIIAFGDEQSLTMLVNILNGYENGRVEPT